MLDIPTSGALRVPMAIEDAILEAWSKHRRRPVSDITVEKETAEERIDQAIALHLLRTVAMLDEQKVADKLGTSKLYVLRLCAELTRQRAHNASLINGRCNSIRTAAYELVRVSLGKAPKPVRVRVKPQGPPMTTIDNTLAYATTQKVCGIFRASITDVVVHKRILREAAMARRMAMLVLYTIVAPESTVAALSRFFGVGYNAADHAITTAITMVRNPGQTLFANEIEALCRAYATSAEDLGERLDKRRAK